MDPQDEEIARIQEERKAKEAELAAMAAISYDKSLYAAPDKFAGFETSIAANEDEEEQDAMEREVSRKLASYTAPKSVLNDLPRGEVTDEQVRASVHFANHKTVPHACHD